MGNIKNCQFSAPGYANRAETCIGVGYGQDIDARTLESRRFTAFYSHVSTAESFYVELLFKTWPDYRSFNDWLSGYFDRVTDPTQSPLMPMWVDIQNSKRNFHKRGYPITAGEYGDEFGKIIYQMTIQFVAADDASVNAQIASRFTAPINDAVARNFAPSLLSDSVGTPILTPYNPNVPI